VIENLDEDDITVIAHKLFENPPAWALMESPRFSKQWGEPFPIRYRGMSFGITPTIKSGFCGYVGVKIDGYIHYVDLEDGCDSLPGIRKALRELLDKAKREREEWALRLLSGENKDV
jgi:hypothetical protein